MQIGTISSGTCLLVIPSPTDDAVYAFFRSIARARREYVTAEGLWIAGDVPIGACLTVPVPSPALARLRRSGSDIISRIDLRFGGLLLSYVRSGGQGPALFRQSFFDEIRVDCDGPASIHAEDVVEVFREISECLEARRGMGSPEFADLLTQTPVGITMQATPLA